MKLASSVFSFFAAPSGAVTHWLTLSDTTLYRKSGADVLSVSVTKQMRVGDAAATESTGTIKYSTLSSTGVTSDEIAYTGTLTIVSNWVKVIFYLYVDNAITDTQTLLIIDEAKGDRGQIPYPTGIWNITTAYVGTNLTAPYVYYEPGKMYYVLNKVGSFTGINPADDYAANGSNATWIPFEEFKAAFFEIFMANFGKLASAVFSGDYMFSQYGKTGAGVAKEGEGDYAAFNGDFSAASPFIPNFSINLLTGLLRASNAEIEGKVKATDSEFSGNLKGVTGSFKRLNCVDEQGNAVGSIAFDVSGKLWFEGDMQHQGFDYVNNRSYRFLTSNVWCRGSFGSQSLNTLVVWGNYGYYYVDGLSDTHNKKVFYAFSSYNFDGNTYYDIPLYVTTGDASGFPVDLIIFRNTTDGRYKLTAQSGKKVRIINGNDDFNGVWLYHNGGLDQCGGGTTYDMIYCGDKLSPAVSTRPGAGWILGSWRDNNW